MAHLFTLSITEPDLVYHKRFAFSIDSYRLDQKQFFYSTPGMNQKINLYWLHLLFFMKRMNPFIEGSEKKNKKRVRISCGDDLEDPKEIMSMRAVFTLTRDSRFCTTAMKLTKQKLQMDGNIIA
uniref:Ycf2 N-terminal domain-containing protein n=1 Tax=Davidia involucrata TaxID=16924 RepID=A0A5B7BQ57_DAVIN